MVDRHHRRYCHHHQKILKLVFMGQYLTDANFHGDICPYQQYFSYCCPDFRGIIFVQHIFWTKILLIKNFLSENFGVGKHFGSKKIWIKRSFVQKIYCAKIMSPKIRTVIAEILLIWTKIPVKVGIC